MSGNFGTLLDSQWKHSRLAVTSVSIIEMISRYRHDLQTLRKALRPIVSGQVLHISIGYLPISNQELPAIMEYYEVSRPAVATVQARKITQEASFLRFILVAVLVGTFHALIESHASTDGQSTRDPILAAEDKLTPEISAASDGIAHYAP